MAKEKLFQILNYRYVTRLPTVITTNLRLTEIEARLRSRLTDPDLSTVVPITAPDFRSSGDQGVTELSTLSLHADQTFEAFDLRREELPAEAASSLGRAKALAEAFAADPQGWLVLNGPYGCGKTHLAAAVANRRMKLHNERAMFVVVPDFWTTCVRRSTPTARRRWTSISTRCVTAPLLILDDLGTETRRLGPERSYFNCSTTALSPACPRSSPAAPRSRTWTNAWPVACRTPAAAPWFRSLRLVTAEARRKWQVAGGRLRVASRRGRGAGEGWKSGGWERDWT